MAGVGFGEPRMIKILAFGLVALTAAASAQAAELTELAQASAPTDVVPQEAPDAFNETQPSGENSPDASQAAPASKKKWEFATIGYAWLAGAWGETDVFGTAQPVDLDLSFGKVLKAFKFAFMGAAEARHDRFSLFG